MNTFELEIDDIERGATIGLAAVGAGLSIPISISIAGTVALAAAVLDSDAGDVMVSGMAQTLERLDTINQSMIDGFSGRDVLSGQLLRQIEASEQVLEGLRGGLGLVEGMEDAVYDLGASEGLQDFEGYVLRLLDKVEEFGRELDVDLDTSAMREYVGGLSEVPGHLDEFLDTINGQDGLQASIADAEIQLSALRGRLAVRQQQLNSDQSTPALSPEEAVAAFAPSAEMLARLAA